MCFEGKNCLAREILVRYGSRQDVRESLKSNLSPMCGWGYTSNNLSDKKQKMLEFKKGEENGNVILWIDEYISKLEREIEEAKIKEERRG